MIIPFSGFDKKSNHDEKTLLMRTDPYGCPGAYSLFTWCCWRRSDYKHVLKQELPILLRTRSNSLQGPERHLRACLHLAEQLQSDYEGTGYSRLASSHNIQM